MLTVSIAVLDPDLDIFKSLMQSLKQFTPEMTQLLICDNGSVSKDFLGVANQFFGPDIAGNTVKLTVTHKPANTGFAAAHNYNLSLSKNRYFAVLHDDLEFFETWSSPMIAVLEQNPKVAQVNPKQNVYNTLAGNRIGNWEETDAPEYCEASCFIMPTALAKKYRLFSEEFRYHYFEDMDLSLRLQKDGYLLRNTDIKWQHHRGKTTVKLIERGVDIPGYYVVNEFLFKQRWHAYIAKKRFGKTIVVKRASGIEDVFMTLPIIEALKEKHPDSLILLMTQFPDAVQGCFDIDGYVNYTSPVPCTDLIDLDYAYEKDFRKNIIECYAKIAGVKPKKKTATLYTENRDIEYVDNLIKSHPDFIALDFSDSIPGIQWKRQNYVELGKRIKQAGYAIATVGKTSQQYADFLDPDLNLVNVLSLQQTALAIGKSKLFIGNEGLLSRYAQSTNVPHIILFGATQPEYVMDTSLPTFIPVITAVACRGCRHRHAAGVLIDCPRNFVCMEVITVDMVYDTFTDIIKQIKSHQQ